VEQRKVGLRNRLTPGDPRTGTHAVACEDLDSSLAYAHTSSQAGALVQKSSGLLLSAGGREVPDREQHPGRRAVTDDERVEVLQRGTVSLDGGDLALPTVV
jgi:hypothetical protein